MAKFLIHAEQDQVGVATQDIQRSENVEGVYMDNGKKISVLCKDDIPLGHKIALVNMRKGDRVIEYGEQIGVATQDVAQGSHVHTHNIKSLRWSL